MLASDTLAFAQNCGFWPPITYDGSALGMDLLMATSKE